MNYKDLQNIAFLSQEILTESATQEHNALDRWPYTSPYLQESTEVSEERAPGVKPYGGGKEVGDKMRAGYGIKITPKPPSGKKGDGSGYGEDKKFAKPDDKIKKPGTTVPAPKKGGYGRISPVIPYGIGANATKERSANSRIRRLDPGAPTSQKLPPEDKKKLSREIIRKPKNEEYDLYYEERKDLPVSRMSKQARHKAFRLGNEINDPESGIGLNVKDDPTAKQLRNMARVGGKQVKGHIKKGYEQGRLYDPQNAELNWKRNSNEEYDLYDVILSHLLDEGYAETVENAEAIMVNMSEDWRESIFEEYDIYEERKDLPVSRMSKQARHKAFRLGNEINDPESGIGLNVKDDPTAKQLRNMARVGGKQVKGHIKKGYEQGRLYDPQNAELNWKRNSKG